MEGAKRRCGRGRGVKVCPENPEHVANRYIKWKYCHNADRKRGAEHSGAEDFRYRRLTNGRKAIHYCARHGESRPHGRCGAVCDHHIMADQWQQAGAFKCEKTSLRLPLAALLAGVERGGRPLGVALCAARAGGESPCTGDHTYTTYKGSYSK